MASGPAGAPGGGAQADFAPADAYGAPRAPADHPGARAVWPPPHGVAPGWTGAPPARSATPPHVIALVAVVIVLLVVAVVTVVRSAVRSAVPTGSPTSEPWFPAAPFATCGPTPGVDPGATVTAPTVAPTGLAVWLISPGSGYCATSVPTQMSGVEASRLQTGQPTSFNGGFDDAVYRLFIKPGSEMRITLVGFSDESSAAHGLDAIHNFWVNDRRSVVPVPDIPGGITGLGTAHSSSGVGLGTVAFVKGRVVAVVRIQSTAGALGDIESFARRQYDALP